MRCRVHVVPHTHFDAEVFMGREETLLLGFSNLQMAMNLFKSDPDFRFSLDQVCYIEPYLRRHPEEHPFFDEMVKDGRLELTGGMHVMPDLNMPSGESFVRQVAHGRRFFERECGANITAGWTLDSFGHHPQVPQLMAKSGFDYTVFQRLMKKGGPSEFLYHGLDGTELPCHWMPVSYAVFEGAPGNLHQFTAFVEPRLAALAAHAHGTNILALTGADLTPPSASLLRMVKEYNASQDTYELVYSSTREFFSAIEWDESIPVVTDDLNPVFQGCYSARIEVKQANRELETLMQNWEKVDGIARILGKGFSVDRRQDAWEKVLFNQFHDIICGSHVDSVFHATMARYDQARAEAQLNTERQLHSIASDIDTSGPGIPVIVFNMLGWDRDDVVESSVVFSDPDVFGLQVLDSRGNIVPSDLLETERYSSGALRITKVLFVAKEVPAFGYEIYRIIPGPVGPPSTGLATSHPLNLREDKDEGWLENEYYRIHFNLWNGNMTKLVDKRTGWNVISSEFPIGNTVVKEQDYGNFWQYNGPCKGDAFHPFSDRYPMPDGASNQADFSHNYYGDGNVFTGKAFVQFTIAHPFGSGQYSTRVRLYAGIERVDIETKIINNDERVRYRVAIPTSISGGKITHEIPFGAIERPEGEYPAQNWIDYADGKRGISLINRGIAGNNVVDGVMMLSLLKCTALKEGYGEVGGFRQGIPTDRGYEKGVEHKFDYALMPHPNDWQHAQSYRRGMEFNVPLLSVNGRKQEGRLPAKSSFCSCSAANVVLSSVEPGANSITLRVYEAEGSATTNVSLRLEADVVSVTETDLTGAAIREIDIDGRSGAICFDIGAFEIKTFCFALG
jgi:alpha-mannosidase